MTRSNACQKLHFVASSLVLSIKRDQKAPEETEIPSCKHLKNTACGCYIQGKYTAFVQYIVALGVFRIALLSINGRNYNVNALLKNYIDNIQAFYEIVH